MKTPKPLLKKMRKLWSPKLPELKTACVSCPFRTGNELAWQEKLEALADHPISPGEAKVGRAMVKSEVRVRGDFACHQTAYDADMKIQPLANHRQCPGAAEFYRECQ